MGSEAVTLPRETRIDHWVDLVMAVQLATRDPGGLAAFMTGHARLPQLDRDLDRPPWTFRGWLLPYVMDLYPGQLGAPGRWGWWLRALTTGELPGPIPQLRLSEPSTGDAAYKSLDRACSWLSQESSHALPLVTEWLAWGLAVADEPAHGLTPKIAEHLYRELSLDGWIERPADYLGLLFSEWGSKGARAASGFYPTPQDLVRVMAQLTGGTAETDPWTATHDPCVGTGRMLLEASNWSLRLCGQDINRLCVLATLINGAVYAPWLSFPLPDLPGPAHEGAETEPVAEPRPEAQVAVQGELFSEAGA